MSEKGFTAAAMRHLADVGLPKAAQMMIGAHASNIRLATAMLSQAAESEAALAEAQREIADLTAERESRLVRLTTYEQRLEQAGMELFEAQRENERLCAQLDDVAISLSHEAAALAVQRQQVRALRERWAKRRTTILDRLASLPNHSPYLQGLAEAHQDVMADLESINPTQPSPASEAGD